MLETGTVVQERYRIVKLLGQGGMGSVYRAWDLRLKVPVALKELLPQPGLDTETLAGLRDQFEQEAGVLARLNHPNLVRVFDFFDEGGKSYLVMDFVEGRSLADLVVQEGAQSETRVLGWARQLLEALDYCHTHGVVHRDIKPQNIILKPDGGVMLVDFGLVKLWDPNDPQTRTVMRGMGTPEYAPPEQYGATKDHTGPPSDIYSLGATLYHLLTGQSPPSATERMAMPEQFVPIRQLVPSVSNQAEYLVMKALALSVSERWQSAREMLAVLVSGPLPEPVRTEYPRTQVAQAPPQTFGGQGMRPTGGGVPVQPVGGSPPVARQRPKGFWLGIVGAVLLCIALVLWRLLYRQADTCGNAFSDGDPDTDSTPDGSTCLRHPDTHRRTCVPDRDPWLGARHRHARSEWRTDPGHRAELVALPGLLCLHLRRGFRFVGRRLAGLRRDDRFERHPPVRRPSGKL